MSGMATRDIRSIGFKEQLDRFKVYRVEEGSHWRGPIDDNNYVLHASTWVPQQHMKSAQDYENDTPYKLEKSSTGLFPEWYFFLLRNFARRSPFHSFYCSKSRDEYISFLAGSPEEKAMVVSAIDWEFSTAFRAGLAPSLDELFEGQILHRQLVESSIVSQLADLASWSEIAQRQKTLILLAMGNDIMPYAQFLMAYDCSENYIWMTLLPLFLKNKDSPEHVKTLVDRVNVLRFGQTPLPARLRDLMSAITDYRHIDPSYPAGPKLAAQAAASKTKKGPPAPKKRRFPPDPGAMSQSGPVRPKSHLGPLSLPNAPGTRDSDEARGSGQAYSESDSAPAAKRSRKRKERPFKKVDEVTHSMKMNPVTMFYDPEYAARHRSLKQQKLGKSKPEPSHQKPVPGNRDLSSGGSSNNSGYSAEGNSQGTISSRPNGVENYDNAQGTDRTNGDNINTGNNRSHAYDGNQGNQGNFGNNGNYGDSRGDNGNYGNGNSGNTGAYGDNAPGGTNTRNPQEGNDEMSTMANSRRSTTAKSLRRPVGRERVSDPAGYNNGDVGQ